ncbi:MAG: hypothetical protein HYW27_02095 [Candidatus Aenigmarchaeota archaeon]|nr:hypothetical protein [Candidatus Aenigmarchaeota archaeon]
MWNTAKKDFLLIGLVVSVILVAGCTGQVNSQNAPMSEFTACPDGQTMVKDPSKCPAIPCTLPATGCPSGMVCDPKTYSCVAQSGGINTQEETYIGEIYSSETGLKTTVVYNGQDRCFSK